jgi:DNA-binding MarR family transcriptional regulator
MHVTQAVVWIARCLTIEYTCIIQATGSMQLTFTTLARRVSRSLSRLERERICCGDVTLQQFETLRMLHDRHELTVGEIADRLEIDLSTASRNLAVLERSGYIARARSSTDARRVTALLTRKGIRCIESLCCDEQSVFEAVLTRIPRNERAAVMRALETLADALDASATDAPASCCAPTLVSISKGPTQ